MACDTPHTQQYRPEADPHLLGVGLEAVALPTEEPSLREATLELAVRLGCDEEFDSGCADE